MTITCIDLGNAKDHILTLGKTYKVLSVNNSRVRFIGNNGKKYTYPSEMFMFHRQMMGDL